MADRITSAQIKEQVESVINRMANSVDAATFGLSMKNHFARVSYLANLSYNNQMLAILQGSTGEVKTFKGWIASGRCVRKGETSHITLIRPNFGKKKEVKDGEDPTYVYFSGYKVFDVSQTDAMEGYVEPEAPVQDDSCAVQMNGLLAACKALNIVYREQPLRKGLYGYSEGGMITLNINLVHPVQKVSTLAHEIAHEVLHQQLTFEERIAANKNRFEYEAEMTAAVLMDYFGLENEFSAAYVKMYGADREKLQNTLKVAQKAVSVILKSMNVKEDEESEEVAA